MRSSPPSSGGELDRTPSWQEVAQLATYAFDVPAACLRVGEIAAHAMRGPASEALSRTDLLHLGERVRPQQEPVVVEDATYDERITGEAEGTRFFAAAPVLDVGRQRIGLLCLADVKPRSFSDIEVHYLRTLADLVGARGERPKGPGDGRAPESVMWQTDEGILVTDPDFQITWINEGYSRISGYTLGELYGRRPRDVLQGPYTDPELLGRIREQLQRGEGYAGELISYRKSGEPYWAHIEAEPIRDDSGVLLGYIAFETEVTDRKIQEELEAQWLERATHAAIDTVRALVAILDPTGRIVRINEAARQLTGYEADEIVGASVLDVLLAEEHRSKMEAVLGAHRVGIRRSEPEISWVTRSGERRRIAWSNTIVTDENDDVRYIILTGIDITEQRRLKDYAVRVSDAERQIIGQDLQDIVAYPLVGAAMMAKGLERRRERGKDITTQDLELLVEHLHEVAQQSRALSRMLLPAKIRGDNLEQVLQQLVVDNTALTGVTASVQADPELPPLGETVATHLYWIVHEAIRNAMTYAMPDHVWVEVFREEDRLILIVRHEGGGPIGAVGIRPERSTMGYRAQLIGATLSIRQVEEGETVVRCELPLGHVDSARS